jgi:hypothetical protein
MNVVDVVEILETVSVKGWLAVASTAGAKGDGAGNGSRGHGLFILTPLAKSYQ